MRQVNQNGNPTGTSPRSYTRLYVMPLPGLGRDGFRGPQSLAFGSGGDRGRSAGTACTAGIWTTRPAANRVILVSTPWRCHVKHCQAELVDTVAIWQHRAQALCRLALCPPGTMRAEALFEWGTGQAPVEPAL